ncbi:apolipoprotein N-acyltransferase [Sphingomicrobium sp. XHP0239]|uniref:apolipoprotein N-acyltransferase n=1 Tax=Sphingomicrobium maritimum TaxID=3133972 RepID=UPI0031CCBDA5
MERLRALAAGRRTAPWLALGLGLLSAVGFAPLGLWPLTIISFAGLIFLIHQAPTWRLATFNGWMFGLGQFVLGLNWIATAFTYQAAMPAWLGWVAVVLLSFYLAVYPAIAALIAKFASRTSTLALPFALAGGWIVGEWLRSFVFTGFAWNPVGVALVDTPLRHLSVWIGTYGLSGIMVLLGGLLFWLAQRRAVAAIATAAAILVATILPRPEVVSDTGPARAPQVRIVQPDISQDDKWRPGFEQIAADKLTRLGTAPSDVTPAVVFWPEVAVLRPLLDERTGAQRLAAIERAGALRGIRPDQTLVTGGIGVLTEDGQTVSEALNSVFVLDPGTPPTRASLGDADAALDIRYDKAHLVPYGEYLPMRWLLEPLGLSRLVPGAFDYRPGPGARTLDLDGIDRRMGVQICYEIIFSGQVADRSNRPDFLFNPSNDAWFGAWGPPQHLAQARLRATEEGLPVIRSTPTGISAMIAADGTLLEHLGMGVEGVIDTALPPAAASPPLFARVGNILALLFAAFLVGLAIALARRAR